MDILPVKLKFIYNDLIPFYRIINGLVPISLPPYISACIPGDVRYTRRNAPIHDLSDYTTFNCSVTPNCDTFRNSFYYRTMKRWNTLPISVRQAATVSIMKSALTDFLWSSDVDWPD